MVAQTPSFKRTYFELSISDSLPKSDGDPRAKAGLIFALVVIKGASSNRSFATTEVYKLCEYQNEHKLMEIDTHLGLHRRLENEGLEELWREDRKTHH